ncbi:hypothetical protein BsWGS_19441 [Bradybaena similaris]
MSTKYTDSVPDWNSVDLDDIAHNGFSNGGRKSSTQSIGLLENKENRRHSHGNNETSRDLASRQELVLARGSELIGESRTELSPTWVKHQIVYPETTTNHVKHPPDSGIHNAKSNKRSSVPTITTDLIPAENITIPSDANISTFTCDQLATFLRCLKIEDRIISHLHRKQVDGKRFSKLKDSELETLGINNPVVAFFRNKSNIKSKGKGPFML